MHDKCSLYKNVHAINSYQLAKLFYMVDTIKVTSLHKVEVWNNKLYTVNILSLEAINLWYLCLFIVGEQNFIFHMPLL